MKKLIIALVMVAVMAAGSVSAQHRVHRIGGRPHHGMVYHEPVMHHHHHHGGNFGSFIIGAAVGALIDHVITEAVTQPVVVEREVIVEREPEVIYDDATEPETVYDEAVYNERRHEPAKVVVVREPAPEVIVVERPGFRMEFPRRHRVVHGHRL